MEKIMKTVIDVGSNSIRFLSDYKGTLEERLLYTRLGEETSENGEISEVAYLRTLEGLRSLLALVPKNANLVITATSALREARNREMICERFFHDTGHAIKVLSGEEEAYYNYMGVRAGLGKKALVLDIGGGSTELVMEGAGGIISQSLAIGAVRFYEAPEAFLPLEAFFEPFKGFKNSPDELVGTGGTITSLAMLLAKETTYKPELVDGYMITRCEVVGLMEALKKSPELLSPLPQKRRDIFPSGLVILERLMTYLSKDRLIASTKDGLYGLYQFME